MSDAVTRLNVALEGSYTIERELGEGGMATVYLANDLKHERQVAIKVLRPELAAVIGAERFLAEIKTTAGLQHPHILPLFDSGAADSFLYYVMPYVEGETLRERIDREKQLPVDEAVEIARDVADALDYAHRRDVIHRDIKPANILLHEGRPVVSDFGIALAISAAGGGRMTETGLSLGTPHYMSPEQASADRDLNARSDVYSVGCVLYEMIAGQPPHTGPSAQSILVRILTEEPRPLTELRRTAPTHVGAAVSKAIEKLPADRFESAVAFREALLDESFRYSPAQRTGPQPGVAPPGTTTARSTSPRPRPWLVPALAVSTVLFAGLSAWGWLGGLGSVASEGPSRLTLDLGVDDPSERAEVTISPDGRTYVVELRDGTGSPLYVRHAHEPDFRALSGTEGARVPAFSPDGLWVAYDHPDDGLMRVAVAGGAPLSVGVDAVDNRRLKWVHWGRAGEIVIGRERVAGTGGVPRTWTETNLLLAVHFLPDGEAILAQTGFDGPITLFDLVSDTSYEVVREGTNPTYIETGHILYTHFDGGLFAVPFDLNAKATTGDPVPVLDGVEGDSYSVSATGTLAHRIGGPTSFFARPDQRLLLVDGTGATDTIRIPPRDMGGPRISPDGRRLAFASDGQIFTYDLERRSGPTQVTFGGENHNPVWSPDGSRIAYEARDGSLPRGRSGAGDQTPDIHVKSVDGIGEPSVLLDLAGRLVPTDWSGAALAFYEQGDGQGSIDPDLWFIDPDAGTEPSDYLSTESWESHMDISPDGAWATYQSEETGRREVYIRAFPSGLGQQRVTVEGGTTPRWSPDGQSIYYIGGSFPNQTIYVSEVQLEPSFLVLSTEVVFTGTVRGFDPHPDGRQILVAESLPLATAPEETEEPERLRWVVVTNWFEEMLERMGEGGR